MEKLYSFFKKYHALQWWLTVVIFLCLQTVNVMSGHAIQAPGQVFANMGYLWACWVWIMTSAIYAGAAYTMGVIIMFLLWLVTIFTIWTAIYLCKSAGLKFEEKAE